MNRPKKESFRRQLPPNFVPSSLDVICGRDQDSIIHDGNNRLRSIIRERLPTYQQIMTKKGKTIFVWEIVALVQHFVRKDLATGRWIEIGTAKAREKVGHIIRAEIRRQEDREHGPAQGGSPSSSPSLLAGAAGTPPPASSFDDKVASPATEPGRYPHAPIMVDHAEEDSKITQPSEKSRHMMLANPFATTSPLPSPKIASLDMNRYYHKTEHHKNYNDNHNALDTKVSARDFKTQQHWMLMKGEGKRQERSKTMPTSDENTKLGAFSPTSSSSSCSSSMWEDVLFPLDSIIARSSATTTIPALTHHDDLFSSPSSSPRRTRRTTKTAAGSDLQAGSWPRIGQNEEQYYSVPSIGLLPFPQSSYHQEQVCTIGLTAEDEKIMLRVLPLPDHVTVRESQFTSRSINAAAGRRSTSTTRSSAGGSPSSDIGDITAGGAIFEL